MSFDARDYSTFTGKLKWKFTRKNHFYVTVSPFDTDRTTTLTRTFAFQGQTFNAGSITRSDLHALPVAPGYQYDIIRRERGHLGIGLQVDLFDTPAKISAAAQIINGKPQAAVSASGSLLPPKRNWVSTGAQDNGCQDCGTEFLEF